MKLKLIKSLLKDCIIVDFNSTIKEHAINLRRKYRLKLPDAIIAASCQQLALPLITVDSDFAKIKDIATLVVTT
jgi:predicted nucleic acid-binding protein